MLEKILPIKGDAKPFVVYKDGSIDTVEHSTPITVKETKNERGT